MPSPRPARSRLSPNRLDLAIAASLPKILMSAFFVRDRPGRGGARKSKQASDFPCANPASPASPASPDASSSTRCIPGRSPEEQGHWDSPGQRACEPLGVATTILAICPFPDTPISPAPQTHALGSPVWR
jgi:hypothetical protein